MKFQVSTNKSCVINKMHVPALRFAYSYSYNHVKIVSTSFHGQTKIKKILIKVGLSPYKKLFYLLQW